MNVYSIVVYVENINRMDSILNTLRIGLNNYDRSRVLMYQGHEIVNYTVICTNDEYVSIVNALNAM